MQLLLVEQNPANVAQFPADWLHNTKNLVFVPRDIHQNVTGIFNTSVGLDTSGARLRDVISGMGFGQQHEFGSEILQQSTLEFFRGVNGK